MRCADWLIRQPGRAEQRAGRRPDALQAGRAALLRVSGEVCFRRDEHRGLREAMSFFFLGHPLKLIKRFATLKGTLRAVGTSIQGLPDQPPLTDVFCVMRAHANHEPTGLIWQPLGL